MLETTAQILLVHPFHENFGKRLVKSPKVYFLDSGLACHLLGIDSGVVLARSPFLEPLFEGLVASEIVKAQVHSGRRREIYCFRDRQGLEVDFLVPTGAGRLALSRQASRAARSPPFATVLAGNREAISRRAPFVLHSGSRPP